MKISYLGPEGTYCHSACNVYTKNKEYQKVPASEIAEVVELLAKDKVEECIVPIENSIKGNVYETVEAIIANKEIHILNEVILDINHCLLANESYDLKDIKVIYSHKQALGQCKKFIEDNLKNCILKEIASTAQGAEAVKKEKNSACIANKICKDLYDLKLIQSNIQDKPNNKTKFLVLGKHPNENKEHNKISAVFTTLNKPGALCDILNIFKIFDINLTKIESRPTQNKLGEYLFWVDFEGNIEEQKMTKILELIKDKCGYFRVLGMYTVFS